MSDRGVKKRQVFYLQGFDPMVPRRYREIYRTEGAKQARISGYSLKMHGCPKRDNHYQWKVHTKIDGQETNTTVTFLLWSDIVRNAMDISIPATFLLMIKTYWIYTSSGALRKIFSLRIGPVIAGFYPPLVLILQLLVSVGLAGLIVALADRYAHWGLGLVAGAVLIWWLMRWFKAHDGYILAYYLLYDYAYKGMLYGENSPEIEARLKVFKKLVQQSLKSDVDEVLIVGHSSGAYLAVSLLADVLRERKSKAERPALALMTLGHVIPLVSFLPKAERLRSDLHYLSQSDDLAWIDVTSLGDGACYALCDPVMVSGVAPPAGQKKWPLVFSAAFGLSLKPETYKKLRRRFFTLHFQYLHAFDQPRDYDYFQITAGPKTLADRYRDRVPSKSRIERATSPHRSYQAVRDHGL